MGWQDAPIVAPAAKGRWQDAPLIRPAPPGEQFGPPMPPEETSFLGEIARGLQLGTQASGAGMADLAGFPVDMTTLALNAAIRALKARGGAALIMAHRPAAIQECDTLLVLEDGTRRAFGPRDQVLREMVKNHADITRAPVTGPTDGALR